MLTGLRSSPDLMIGAILLLLHIALIIIGPFFTPYPFTEFHMTDALKPPSWQYWFGTDNFGRDVFSRVIYGAHGTLLLSASATALGVGLGVAIGMTVGYRGGRWDEVVMRIMDGMLSFPSLLLAMLIMSSLSPQTGSGGCTPMPMKPSDVLSRIANDSRIASSTTIGPRALGSSSRVIT